MITPSTKTHQDKSRHKETNQDTKQQPRKGMQPTTVGGQARREGRRRGRTGRPITGRREGAKGNNKVKVSAVRVVVGYIVRVHKGKISELFTNQLTVILSYLSPQVCLSLASLFLVFSFSSHTHICMSPVLRYRFIPHANSAYVFFSCLVFVLCSSCLVFVLSCACFVLCFCLVCASSLCYLTLH